MVYFGTNFNWIKIKKKIKIILLRHFCRHGFLLCHSKFVNLTISLSLILRIQIYLNFRPPPLPLPCCNTFRSQSLNLYAIYFVRVCAYTSVFMHWSKWSLGIEKHCTYACTEKHQIQTLDKNKMAHIYKIVCKYTFQKRIITYSSNK